MRAEKYYSDWRKMQEKYRSIKKVHCRAEAKEMLDAAVWRKTFVKWWSRELNDSENNWKSLQMN